MSKYYISYIKNKEILLESASGGVFTALSEYVLNRGGIVFGVSEDESCIRYTPHMQTALIRWADFAAASTFRAMSRTHSGR